METNELIETSIYKLFNWVLSERYLGWDPYDALNSEFFTKECNKNIKILLIQANKYSPLNFRPILRIKKGLDLKGIALFARAYSRLLLISNNNLFRAELLKCLKIIEEKSLRDIYGLDCWASHYFPYISTSKKELQSDIPDIIGTSQAIIALVEGYNLCGERKFKDMAISAGTFLLNDFIQNDTSGCYVKYTLTERGKKILNASAQGLEALSNLLTINYDENILNICQKISQNLISSQKNDGSWIYSLSENGHVRNQLDFHQGYIIDGLLSFKSYSSNEFLLINCIQKAANFYKLILFSPSGESYYRYPLRYPLDIHNQSQGIITFSKLYNLNTDYIDFSNTIALKTISKMQDHNGFFYYQIWPFFINKIPHMRWSQAWMMFALSTYLYNYKLYMHDV